MLTKKFIKFLTNKKSLTDMITYYCDQSVQGAKTTATKFLGLQTDN
jgi:hypothetical protein